MVHQQFDLVPNLSASAQRPGRDGWDAGASPRPSSPSSGRGSGISAWRPSTGSASPTAPASAPASSPAASSSASPWPACSSKTPPSSFADEPVASLDPARAEEVLRILADVARGAGKTPRRRRPLARPWPGPTSGGSSGFATAPSLSMPRPTASPRPSSTPSTPSRVCAGSDGRAGGAAGRAVPRRTRRAHRHPRRRYSSLSLAAVDWRGGVFNTGGPERDGRDRRRRLPTRPRSRRARHRRALDVDDHRLRLRRHDRRPPDRHPVRCGRLRRRLQVGAEAAGRRRRVEGRPGGVSGGP